jgi:hypothetical protein
MKKNTLAIGLSAMLAFGACSSTRTTLQLTPVGAPTVQATQQNETAPEETAWVGTTLQMMPGDGHTYLISRESGERDLHNLAKEADKEDLFYHYAGIWKDIGRNESGNEASTTVDNDFINLLPKEIFEGSTMFVYHYHPLKVGPAEYVYPPAPEDVLVHAVLKQIMRDKFKTSLESKVMDGFGVWDLDVTRSLESNVPIYKKPDDPEATFRDGVKEISMLLTLHYFVLQMDVLTNTKLLREERIQKFISEFEKLGVLLKYSPINDPDASHPK